MEDSGSNIRSTCFLRLFLQPHYFCFLEISNTTTSQTPIHWCFFKPLELKSSKNSKSFFYGRVKVSKKNFHEIPFSNTITTYSFSFLLPFWPHIEFFEIYEKKTLPWHFKILFPQVRVLCVIPTYPDVGCVRVFLSPSHLWRDGSDRDLAVQSLGTSAEVSEGNKTELFLGGYDANILQTTSSKIFWSKWS